MSDQVRLPAVGLGRWARVWARGTQRGDVVELYSCFSRSEDGGAAFREAYDVPKSASTYEELLSGLEVEGVIVTTPSLVGMKRPGRLAGPVVAGMLGEPDRDSVVIPAVDNQGGESRGS